MENFYWAGQGMPLARANYQPMSLRFKLYGGMLLGLLLSFAAARAQAPSPHRTVVQEVKLGATVPADFWTHKHLFYVNGDTIRQSLAAYKGKMVVLDFWFSGCPQCLLHQQEINYFKKAYADDLQVIMVNSLQSKENYAQLEQYFASDRFKRLGLSDFVSIIEDDYLESLFAHGAYPSYFWINPLGVLQLYTFRNLLDRAYTVPFIDKKP